MRRAETCAAVRALHDEGLNGVQISERLGISRSYVYELLNDPDGARVRARKDSYREPCPQCGEPMDGSNGRQGPVLCLECRRWTREACIEAIQDWAEANGGIPPRMRDTEHSGGRLPPHATVRKMFGCWNDGIRAAGFVVRMDRYPETWEAILAAVQRGEPTADIADRHGVTPGAIHQRFKVRGLRVRDFQPDRRAAA